MCFHIKLFLGSKREKAVDIQLKQRPYKLFTHTKINSPQVNPVWIRGPTALFSPNNSNRNPNPGKRRAADSHPHVQNAGEGFVLSRAHLCYN